MKINFLVDGTRISKKRTHMKKRTLNPVYNESFVFDLPSTVVDLHNVCIEFCVFDHDRVTKNEVSSIFIFVFSTGAQYVVLSISIVI